MTTHRDACLIATPIEQVFDLVADVERYPEFLSLWRYARVYRREGDDVYMTEQEIGLGPVRERFRTRTELRRPDRIDVFSDDPLFRTFHICWTFEPIHIGCRAAIALTWEVRSPTLQKAIDLALPMVARSMVDAFHKRADHVLR
jgi:coenzyme Q-binding protein COQ10